MKAAVSSSPMHKPPNLIAGMLLLSLALSAPALSAGKAPKGKKRVPSASAGATRPTPPPALTPEQERYFRALDLDGDGQVSLAEAAGYADVVTGFDRADRSRDGKLSGKEFHALIRRKELLAKREEKREEKREAARKAKLEAQAAAKD